MSRWTEIVTLVKTRGHLIVGISSLGFFLLGVGAVFSLWLSKNDWQEIEVIKGQNSAGDNQAGQNAGEITVDVGGAVEKPGVYRLPAGLRINDALIAAGGLSATADRDRLARDINLAQNITDGMKIYIYDTKEATVYNAAKTATGESRVLSTAAAISINTASVSELDSLWGIGQARAEAIVAGRPYGSIDELVDRKIVPKNVVEKNKDKLRL